MVVDVDDGAAAPLGFRGRDLAKQLEAQGYEVFGLEYRLVGPNEVRQAACEVLEHEGELAHLLALPPGLATAQTIECCRRSVLEARREAVATAALRAAPRAAVPRATAAQPVPQPEDEALQARLEALQASMSWRLGHGIVVTAKRIVRPARRLVVALRRVTRGGRGWRGGT
jgi:hypothetical protein